MFKNLRNVLGLTFLLLVATVVGGSASLPKQNCLPSTAYPYTTLCVQTINNVKQIGTPRPKRTHTPSPSPSPTQQPTATPTPVPTPTPTPVPTLTPSPTPSPGETIVWQAGDPNLGKWEIANTYQCGTPINNGTEFDFTLVQNGTNCGRNQANPLDPSGNTLVFVNIGQTYTWTWHEIDGPYPPGMGPDAEAESLVWQIHGLNEPHTPCTSLNFQNGTNDIPPGPQMWAFRTCAGIVWVGDYVPGESDDWAVRAKISEGSDGWTELWRNGQLMGHWNGANGHESPTHQYWWNFGPYKWRWELSGEGGSTMTEVTQTYQGMLLQTP